jgi:ketosteroid isomerase-like protein
MMHPPFLQRSRNRGIPLLHLVLAVVAFQAGPATASAGAAGLAPEEVQAIRAVSKQYVEAMRANDWPSVAAFFAPDATRMPPNQPLHQGRAAIEQWLSQIDSLSLYTITLDEIEGSGGYAYARARYTIQLKLRPAAPAGGPRREAVMTWLS